MTKVAGGRGSVLKQGVRQAGAGDEGPACRCFPGTPSTRAGEDDAGGGSCSDVERMLADLSTLIDDVDQASRRLQDHVALLRAHRATWVEIGMALGVSRQAAWQRFSRCAVTPPAPR